MTMYRIFIDRQVNRGDDVEPFAELYSDEVTVIVGWMRDQAERIRKERYMAPRFEGEEPVECLDLHFEPATPKRGVMW